jgi:DNA polymerase III subunit delta'
MTAILGHDTQFDAMRAAIDSGRMHHAWLLHGPKGVGKAGFAKIVAAKILAEAAPGLIDSHSFELPDDHPSARLIAARSHPDYQLIEREAWVPKSDPARLIPYADRKGDEPRARSIRINQIRWLGPILSMAPSLAARRVILIDAIDDLEPPAANALLKMLEEPPASTTFLLVSHAPGRLLPTIRSRCRSLAFARLSDDVMTAMLAEHAPELDDMTRAVVIAVAGGAPGAALSVIEADVPGIDAALREIAATGDPYNVLRLDLSGKLALKAALPRYQAFLARAPAFIAAQARTRTGEGLATAIDAWEKARQLADVAIPQSLPQESVVFEIAGRVAALAHGDARAKA